MTVVTMSHVPNTSSGSKKSTSSRGSSCVDPRIVIARLYHLQRLQREAALRTRPEPMQYLPRMDLYDDETSPNVSAMLELPGVDRGSLSLQVQGNKLIVHGQRASPLASKLQSAAGEQAGAPAAPQNFKVRELKFGSFHREIDIPLGIDTTQITAELSDGMLLITWPRLSSFAAGRANARAT